MRLVELSFDILCAFCTAFSILFVIYKTDAIPSYLKLFKYDDSEYKTTLSVSNFPEYLHSKKDTFWTRLISCPYCFGFWICLFSSLAFCGALYFPICYTLLILSWNLLNF